MVKTQTCSSSSSSVFCPQQARRSVSAWCQTVQPCLSLTLSAVSPMSPKPTRPQPLGPSFSQPLGLSAPRLCRPGWAVGRLRMDRRAKHHSYTLAHTVDVRVSTRGPDHHLPHTPPPTPTCQPQVTSDFISNHLSIYFYVCFLFPIIFTTLFGSVSFIFLPFLMPSIHVSIHLLPLHDPPPLSSMAPFCFDSLLRDSSIRLSTLFSPSPS